MATQKKENVTGLEQANNPIEAEKDLLQTLFDAADFKNEDVYELDITRKGKVMFTLHVHPISDSDAAQARKQATKFKDHPQGKKYGKVEIGFDNSKFKSWLIYLATTEDDQQKIWGNKEFMRKFGLMEPWESIDKILTLGDKSKLLDKITDISGLDDEDEEAMDDVTFQS
jgi:hypothetical protein